MPRHDPVHPALAVPVGAATFVWLVAVAPWWAAVPLCCALIALVSWSVR